MAFRKLATLALLALLAIDSVFAGTPIPGPNYEPVKQALKNLSAVMDRLVIDIPKLTDDAGIARALDGFSMANEDLASSLRELLHQNPEIGQMKEPPPELADLSKGQMHIKYDEIAHKLAEKARDHSTNSLVREAVSRFVKSAASVAASGQ